MSGPQDAVPRPRWAASRCTTHRVGAPVRRGGGGGQVGRPVAGDLHLPRRVQPYGQPAARVRARQQKPPHPVPSPALLRPDVRGEQPSTRDAEMADRPARAPVRVVSQGPWPYHSMWSRPHTVSKTVPTRAASVSPSGRAAVSSTSRPPSGSGVKHLEVFDGARGGRIRPRTRAGAPSRSTDRPVCVPSRPSPRVRHRSAAPPSRSLSVGARHRRARAGRSAADGATGRQRPRDAGRCPGRTRSRTGAGPRGAGPAGGTPRCRVAPRARRRPR